MDTGISGGIRGISGGSATAGSREPEDHATVAAASHQDNEPIESNSDSSSNQPSDHYHQQQAASMPLVHLINESFVSQLPMSGGCADFLSDAETGSQARHQVTNMNLTSASLLLENHHHHGEESEMRERPHLCLIDWSQGEEILHSENYTAHLKQSSFINLTHRQMITDNNQTSHLNHLHSHLHSSNHQWFHNNHQHHHNLRALLNDSELTGELVYLSASSLLSLVGIFTNLLILMIIIINTKQKCHSFLSRTNHTTSHTNYHYVLLFQLTLTGLLLGGYVLFSTSGQLYTLMATAADDAHGEREFLTTNYQHQPQVSPLSIYLPPPFRLSASNHYHPSGDHYQAGALVVAHHQMIEPRAEGREQEPEQVVPRPSRAVIVPVRCLVQNKKGVNREAGQGEREEPLEMTGGGGDDGVQNSLGLTVALFNLIGSVHIWTVAALAYDRYCAIAHPLEYLRAINAARAKTFLLILWSGALLTNVLLPLTLDELQRHYDGGGSVFPRGGSNQVEIIRLLWLGSDTKTTEPKPPNRKCPHNSNLLMELSANLESQYDDLWLPNVALPLASSLLTFVLVILMPLISVTICNVSIYGIVKVHERRLSASSGSQSGSNQGCGGGHGAMAAVASKFKLVESAGLAAFYHSDQQQQQRDKQADDASSLASSILGKLIRSSAQVGSLAGTTRQQALRSNSTSSSMSEPDPEICNLMLGAASGECNSSIASHSPEQERHAHLARTHANGGGGRNIHSMPSSRKSSLYSMAAVAADGMSTTASACAGGGGGGAAPAKQLTLVNRSRRLGSLNKLMTAVDKTDNNNNNKNKNNLSSPQDFMLTEDSSKLESPSRLLFLKRKKLKRKLSDKEEANQQQPLLNNRSVSRRGSLVPSEQTLLMDSGCCNNSNQRQPMQDCDTCSCQSGASSMLNRNNSQQYANQQQQQALVDSDGILRQIKMAGLSFAGIAINELMQAPGGRHAAANNLRHPRRLLNRSSSCSFGNLASATNCLINSCTCQQQQQQQQQQSEAQPQQADKKLGSLVTLNMKCGAIYGDGDASSKCSTRLVHMTTDNADLQTPTCQHATTFGPTIALGLSSNQNNSSTRSQSAGCSQQHQHHHHNFIFGGTKSIAFNVVVWLLLALLICSLPQYCLLLINFYRRHRPPISISDLEYGVGSLNVELVQVLKDLLHNKSQIEQELENGEGTPKSQESHLPIANIDLSLWLMYVCRLLFLSMLPLNAWLYGIRSRSLKTTLKTVLRRYISKKQASIEINQRRKSRDSSLSCRTNSRNSSLFYPNYQPNQAYQQQLVQQQQHHGCINGRVFRRCASFNLPPVGQQQADQRFPATLVCGHHHHCEMTHMARCNNIGKQMITRHPPPASSPRTINQAEPATAITLTTTTTTTKPVNEEQIQTHRSHNNSIRFVLGDDENNDTSKVAPSRVTGLSGSGQNSCSLMIPNQQSFSSASQNSMISLNSSLASSNRSLLSASIQSSHSAALILLDPQQSQGKLPPVAATSAPAIGLKCSAIEQAKQQLSPSNKPLTSVLKKRDSKNSMTTIQHQDSLDSACSAGQGHSNRFDSRPTLDRVQSSPGKILVVSRPRSLFHQASKGACATSTPSPYNVQPGPDQIPFCATAGSPNSITTTAPGTTMFKNPSRKQMVRQEAQDLMGKSQDEEDQTREQRQVKVIEAEVAPNQRAHSVRGNFSRKGSSDIRLLLTSADDDDLIQNNPAMTSGASGVAAATNTTTTTDLLLDTNDDENDDEDGARQSPAFGEHASYQMMEQLLGDDHTGLGMSHDDSGLVVAPSLGANCETNDGSKSQLDYYKQIKDAIAKYFFGLKRDKRVEGGGASSLLVGKASEMSTQYGVRNVGEQLSQHRRCSCDASRKNSDSSQFSLMSDQSMLMDECEHTATNGGVSSNLTATATTPTRHQLPWRKNSLDSQVMWHSQTNKTHHQLHHQQQQHHNHHHHHHNHHHHHVQQQQQHLANNSTRRASHFSLVNDGRNHNQADGGVNNNGNNIKASSSIDSITSSSTASAEHAHTSHLRPPNFLKLMLDADNQQASNLYSSSLALSPIKETSSYASSNSSLNQQQQQSQPPQQPPPTATSDECHHSEQH